MMLLNMGRDYDPIFSVMCARGDSGGDQPLVRMIHLSPGSGARGHYRLCLHLISPFDFFPWIPQSFFTFVS